MPKPKANARRQDGEPVNKSAAIREMLARSPKAPVKEIVSLLAQKGIRVRPTMVYYVRSKQQHQQRREKRERVAATTQRAGITNPVELVLQVKSLARDAGGIGKLKQLVDVLAE
jgi:hypothetical protein